MSEITTPPREPSGPGTNTGHGHVWPRPDGVKARCGGPGICEECASDIRHVAAIFVLDWVYELGVRDVADGLRTGYGIDHYRIATHVHKAIMGMDFVITFANSESTVDAKEAAANA